MVKIALVDDDAFILDRIQELIEDTADTDLHIDKYSDSLEFYNSEHKAEYDVVFLDIDMPNMSGFDLADTLKLLKKSMTIIFISNLEHLVYESLQFKPFRFVRKSFLKDDVTSAIRAYLVERSRDEDTFLIKNGGVSMQIRTTDIIYFESLGHSIFIKTSDENRIQLTRERNNSISILSLSEQFRNKGFMRVHKSFLVNYRYIYIVKHSEVILKNHK